MTAPAPVQGQESAASLGRVNAWSALALAVYAPLVLIDARSGAGWRAWAFFCAVLLQVANLLYSLFLLRRERFERALNLTLWGSLMVFTVGALHADNNPATAVLPVVIAAVALPHVNEMRFVRYCLLCLGALFLNVLVLALWPLRLAESEFEHAFSHWLATSAAAGICMLLFWQIKRSLVLGRQAKDRAAAEAGLEEERYRKVLEGTGEGIWWLGEGAGTVIMNKAMQAMLDEASRPELAEWILGAVLKGERLEQEIQLPSPGGAQRSLLVAAHGLRSAERFLEGALVVATDITELKQARGRIARSLGVEAEGRLAGGITHDMNNVLAVVRGSCDLLAQDLEGRPGGGDALRALAKIQGSCDQATRLVGQLLSGPTAAQAGATQAQVAAGASTAPEGALTRILLVDDDDDVRAMAARALRSEGCDVLEASGADGARKIMASLGDSVGLLVTDVMMPVCPGPELAAELKSSHPFLKVLFISGYAGELLGGQEKLWPEGSFLAKPFSAAELAAKVKGALA